MPSFGSAAVGAADVDSRLHREPSPPTAEACRRDCTVSATRSSPSATPKRSREIPDARLLVLERPRPIPDALAGEVAAAMLAL
jgi:hypothetical protein